MILLLFWPCLAEIYILLVTYTVQLYQTGFDQSVSLMFVSEMQLLLFLPFLFHNKVSISVDTGILIFLT